MINRNKKIIFLCGARDYHALDWYKSAKLLLKKNKLIILTDILNAEGLPNLTTDDDKVVKLFIIDKFLFKNQSVFGNYWRNFIKYIFLPIQVLLLKKFYKKNINTIFHAHGMYYMYLASLAKVPYVGTPQGSEILVRPYKSIFYRKFAARALKYANTVSVDSSSMKIQMKNLFNIDAHIIQNGIDLSAINEVKNTIVPKNLRYRYTSIRGLSSLYRIHDLANSINKSNLELTILYPFFDENYKNELFLLLKNKYYDLGRLSRNDMYKVLFESKVVFSVPISDSSPRSVYESIFCGAIVIITYQKYYDELPLCMKRRIIVVNLENENFLEVALNELTQRLEEVYIPSKQAIEMFDQKITFLELSKKLYQI